MLDDHQARFALQMGTLSSDIAAARSEHQELSQERLCMSEALKLLREQHTTLNEIVASLHLHAARSTHNQIAAVSRHDVVHHAGTHDAHSVDVPQKYAEGHATAHVPSHMEARWRGGGQLPSGGSIAIGGSRVSSPRKENDINQWWCPTEAECPLSLMG